MIVAVLGAASKTGVHVVTGLCARGHAVRAVSRDPAKFTSFDRRAQAFLADLDSPSSLASVLNGVECVVSLAPARYAQSLLAILPATCRRVVLTGSVRKFSRLEDPVAAEVRAGEAAFLASGLPGVMLHPSMIYGMPQGPNVGRILRLLRAWPSWLPIILPLPDGGRRTVQPVFIDDLVAAFVAAVERSEVVGMSIAVAGPEPITYRRMVEICAAAVHRSVLILPLSAGLLVCLTRVLAKMKIRSPFAVEELTRTGEDKSFDISALYDRLGVLPRSFEEGVRQKLERGWI